jgi:hypothetical protein
MVDVGMTPDRKLRLRMLQLTLLPPMRSTSGLTIADWLEPGNKLGVEIDKTNQFLQLIGYR